MVDNIPVCCIVITTVLDMAVNIRALATFLFVCFDIVFFVVIRPSVQSNRSHTLFFFAVCSQACRKLEEMI